MAALNSRVGQLIATAKYAEALPLEERALALAEGGGASEQRGLAIALHNLAYAYQHLGRIRDSEPLLKHSISVLEQLVDSEMP